MPEVSVIMSVYNAEKTVGSAIRSVIEQEYKDLEFIICNDGSNDNSGTVIEEYSSLDYRIKVINNETNQGLPKCLNRCIKLAKGKYIARQDADDISLSYRLKDQVDFLERNEKFSFVGSSCFLMNHNDTIWGFRRVKEQPTFDDLLKMNRFVHPSVTLRSSFFEHVGLYDENLLRSQDYELWLRAYSNDIFGYNLLSPMIIYREDVKDFKRKTFSAQLRAMGPKLRTLKYMNVSLFEYLTTFRPLLVAILPKRLLYRRLRKHGIEQLEEYLKKGGEIPKKF